MAKRKRLTRLTKAQREIVHAKPTANAGAGWAAYVPHSLDGPRYEIEGELPELDFLDDPERAQT
jgi:hypothetical protein